MQQASQFPPTARQELCLPGTNHAHPDSNRQIHPSSGHPILLLLSPFFTLCYNNLPKKTNKFCML